MRSRRICVWACLVTAMPLVASSQTRQSTGEPPREFERAVQVTRVMPLANDVLSGPVVTDAPFSADATTTVTQVLSDGTRIEQNTTARYYRDRAGRVRREQTILGLGALNAGANLQTITIDPDPGDGTAYTLDPSTRSARRVPRLALPLNGNVVMAYRSTSNEVIVQGRATAPLFTSAIATTAMATAANEESLGTRQIEGVRALGRKTTTVIPVGQIGNDRPIEVTDERWESPELRMLLYSRNSDPRTGVVEYRLTNINRADPPADLFTIPSDYTISQSPLPPPPPPPAPAPPGTSGRGRETRPIQSGR